MFPSLNIYPIVKLIQPLLHVKTSTYAHVKLRLNNRQYFSFEKIMLSEQGSGNIHKGLIKYL